MIKTILKLLAPSGELPQNPIAAAPTSLKLWAGESTAPCRFADPDELMRATEIKRYIDDIYSAFDGCSRPDFDRTVMPLLRISCEFFQLLPASEGHHHRFPGGLLLHSLDVCLRALEKTRNFGSYLPSMPMELDHLRQDHIFAGRVCIIILSLTHDMGKISKDMVVTIRSPAGSIIQAHPPYESSPTAKYSTSLIDWAKTEYGSDFQSQYYLWQHVQGRSKDPHALDWACCIQALLFKSAVKILPEAQKHYLELTSAHFQNIIKPLITAVDRISSEEDIKAFKIPDTHVCAAYKAILRYWALAGLLNNLPREGDAFFLSEKVVVDGLTMLPHYEDFANAFKSPSSPKRFLNYLKAHGLHNPSQANHGGSQQLDLYGSNVGLWLSAATSAQISHFRPHLKAQEVPPQQAADDAGGELSPAIPRPSDGKDVSSLGVSIAPPPKEDPAESIHSETAPPAPIPTTDLYSFDLPSNITQDLLLLANHIDCINLQALSTDSWAIEEKRLVFQKKWLNKTVSEIKIDRTSLLEHASALKSRWTLEDKGGLLNRVRCTPEYSLALLESLSLQHLLHSEPSPPTPTVEKKPPLPASRPAITSSKDEISANGFLAFLSKTLNSAKATSTPSISIEVDVVRIPLSVVDEYIGKPQLRGKLISKLEQRKLLVNRTKNYYFLTLSDTAVKQCLGQ